MRAVRRGRSKRNPRTARLSSRGAAGSSAPSPAANETSVIRQAQRRWTRLAAVEFIILDQRILSVAPRSLGALRRMRRRRSPSLPPTRVLGNTEISSVA